jgi:ASC-1-like (ASCH) protein
MDHIAIMKKSWGLLSKILTGQKKIESRWYKAKVAPWNRIATGDTVYFKNSGEPITIKAEVEKVLEFENYNHDQLKEIITTYGGEGKICFRSSQEEVIEWAKEKRYAILVFLKNPEAIQPFHINKKGFGSACAWITIEDINTIKC